MSTIRFEEDGGGNFLVEGGFLDRLHGLSVQPYRMGLELAADVGGHRPFQTGFAKLFEHSRPELRIFQGGGPWGVLTFGLGGLAHHRDRLWFLNGRF